MAEVVESGPCGLRITFAAFKTFWKPLVNVVSLAVTPQIN